MSEEAIKTIESLITLIQTKNPAFSSESWEKLSEINHNLDQLNNEVKAFDISQIILAWTKKYPKINSALSEESKQRIDYSKTPSETPTNNLIENITLTPDERLKLLKSTIENRGSLSPSEP